MEEREYLQNGVRDKTIRRHTLFNSIRRYIPKNTALKEALMIQAERELRTNIANKNILAQKEAKRIAQMVVDVARSRKEKADAQRKNELRNSSISNRLYFENMKKKRLEQRHNYLLAQQGRQSFSLDIGTIGTELSRFEGELNNVISFANRPISPMKIVEAKNSLLMKINLWARKRFNYMNTEEKNKYFNLLRRLREV